MKYNDLFSPETKYAKFMNVLAGVIWTGLLWVLCSLPVFTMGTATCAAHDTMRRAVRRPGNTVTKTFFSSFKANFKLTIPFDIILTLIFGLLFFDSVYLYGYGTEFSQMLSFVIYGFVAFFVVLSIYIFSLCSYYDDTRFEITKLAFYITFRHFPFSLLFFVMLLIMIYAVWLMPWSIMLLPGFFWYAQTFFMQFIMRHYLEEDEEEEETEWHVEEEEGTEGDFWRRNKKQHSLAEEEELYEEQDSLPEAEEDFEKDRIVEKK